MLRRAAGNRFGAALAGLFITVPLQNSTTTAIINGFALFTASQTAKRRQIGRALLGVGLIMLALRLIVAAAEPLRDSPALEAVLAGRCKATSVEQTASSGGRDGEPLNTCRSFVNRQLTETPMPN